MPEKRTSFIYSLSLTCSLNRCLAVKPSSTEPANIDPLSPRSGMSIAMHGAQARKVDFGIPFRG